MSEIFDSLAAFAAYFAAAVLLTVVFVFIYVQSTPHNEIKLTREGNGAAALGLTGAVLGFVIPLSAVISVSYALPEAVLWGALALIIQVAGQFCARLFMPKLTKDIVDGKYAAAIVQCGVALSLGLLQAACWTP